MESGSHLSIDVIAGNCIKKELHNVVKKLTGDENAELSIEPGSKKGDNYNGEIYRVLCKNHNSNETSLILKIALQNPVRREVSGTRNLFLREIYTYDKIISSFNDFQLSKGIVPKQNGFNEFAKCYSSISDEMSESVFLEDLKLKQFEMLNLRERHLTFEHVALVMKALGKFHAVSFAMKDQQPERFQQLSSSLYEQNWTLLEGDFMIVYDAFIKSLMNCMKKAKRFDLFEKFTKLIGGDLRTTVLKMVSGILAEPYAVICHGDVTTNNSMFREDNQGKPIEMKLFDWQFSRYASPVTELVLYLLCSTTKELRDKHYDEFLKIYHESLSDLLMRLGSNPEKLFPFPIFMNECKKFGGYTAFVGAMLMPMLWPDLDTMLDIDEIIQDETALKQSVDNITFTDHSDKTQQTYDKRIIDMFDDMARFGYI